MTTSKTPILVWFRRDLRLADNPAVDAAVATGRPLIPLFIWAPGEEGPWAPGAASRWWLHHALAALDAALRERGSRLVVRTGGSLDVLRAVMQETGATEVYWNRLYEPALIARDKAIKAALPAQSYNASLLHEPWTIATQMDKPYQVFTPFYKACLQTGEPGYPTPAPAKLPRVGSLPSLDLQGLELLPKLGWAKSFSEHWTPGEAGAQANLAEFEVEHYSTDRDIPDRAGTSRLSPHLHFGETPSPTCASWSGGSLPTTCSTTSRTPPRSRCAPSSVPFRGRKIPRSSRPGRRGAPGIPSWMPGCASCGPRAGCTTGCA